MEKVYSPQQIEQFWYGTWEKHHYFAPQGSGEPYCIMLPPPNVTGSLHMGHGFQHTLMDILIRYQRMNGRSALWQPGTDHAGISTQLVVENKLERQGISRKNLSREDFLQEVWQWKEESGKKITEQMRRIGSSVDWRRERFTMDEGFSSAVQKVFVQLYEEGLIYRGSRLVNWDPGLGTALSDLEVVTSEEQGSLWYINYPLAAGEGHLTVATTRPETLLGDVAVAVNPQDERYRHLIGKQLQLPLSQRLIPIIDDESVDQDFGTGCVKITPAHDFNDYEMGKRHNLPLINIFTKQARLNNNENVPVKYQDLDRFTARKQIISDLAAAGLLAKTEPYTIKLPRSEKSHDIVEPLLTEQWYVKIKPLAEPAIAAVEEGRIKFVPAEWEKTYFQWMHNIQDWCISRQLWWGHRIPAWYDEQGKAYVGYSEQDVRFRYKIAKDAILQQDEDVLDTWFSSALWPFTTLGWPESSKELKKFYPSSVLLTGFDIIFFWVARMIMMGLKFTNEVPFREVVITGLIRDHEGQKMSKSKGNVLDPLDIIDGIELEDLVEKRTANLLLPSAKEKIANLTRQEFPNGIAAFGTDSLRFTYCSLASTGRNVRFDLQRVEGYRNFCNKLWNAARFILANTEEEQVDLGDGAFQYSAADSWIVSRLQNVIQLSHQYLNEYRFDLLANVLYDFVWHEYCDWYLEFAKPIIYSSQELPAKKRGTRRTLIYVLDKILKLLHPIIPFITEEIWQRISKLTSQNEETIMLCRYPQVVNELINLELEEEISWIQTIIQAIRNVRSEMTISPAKLIPLVIKNANDNERQLINKYFTILLNLSKLQKIDFIVANEPLSNAASIIVGNMELLIPMQGLIDKQAELVRLVKEIAKLDKDIALAASKLNNANFMAKAPPEIIIQEQKKMAQATVAKDKLLSYKNKVETC